jgi:hypothetical protein
MKSVKFLLAIFTAAVVMASCATTQNTSGEDFDENTTRKIGNRVYVDDPYYGTVVLERDPYTGRYFDVTNGYGSLYSPYNRLNVYRGYRSSPRYYRNNTYGGSVERPSKPDVKVNREEARKKILGN